MGKPMGKVWLSLECFMTCDETGFLMIKMWSFLNSKVFRQDCLVKSSARLSEWVFEACIPNARNAAGSVPVITSVKSSEKWPPIFVCIYIYIYILIIYIYIYGIPLDPNSTWDSTWLDTPCQVVSKVFYLDPHIDYSMSQVCIYHHLSISGLPFFSHLSLSIYNTIYIIKLYMWASHNWQIMASH